MRSLGHWQLLCPPWTGTDPPDLHPRGPSPARAADILLNTADESLSPPELEPEPCHCAGNDPHARAGRTPHLGPSSRPSARPTPINRCLARTRQHGNDTPLGSGKFFNLPPQGLGGLARHSARSTLARHWARRSTGSRAQHRTATCSSSLPDSDATLAGARTKALATCTAAQDTLLAQHKTMTRGHGLPAPPVPAHAPAYCQAHLRLATRRAPSPDMTARDTAQACKRHRDLLYSAQACAPHPRRLSSNPQPARAQPPPRSHGPPLPGPWPLTHRQLGHAPFAKLG